MSDIGYHAQETTDDLPVRIEKLLGATSMISES